MKHKIASIMTVLIMSAAVLLVAGCDQLQGNKGENPSNAPSAADLKGVWKMTLKGTDEGQYTTHIYFDGSTIFAASNVAGQFVKYLQTFTYNADGTISMEQPDGAAPAVLTPVKNGEAIDLQTGGVTIAIMTKDADVSPDTIKNAPEIPNP
ncbi:MAG: hypothetical protein P1P65_08215 [Treponema sp.]